MRHYREMILTSRKAVVYEIVLNQIGYHSILCLLLLGYSHLARTFYSPEEKHLDFRTFITNNAFSLMKLRAFFCCASLMS